ncbi:MAG: septum site-determining protein MinC [Acetobacter sp.]|jgi:septum site-determining protein MinC
MSVSMVSEAITLPRIRAGGRSFLALVLTPEAPLDLWFQALDAQIGRSAGFFAGRPIILDMSQLSQDTEGLSSFKADIEGRGIRVIGIEGADPSWSAYEGWDWPAGFGGGRSPSADLEIPDDDVLQPAGARGTRILEEGLRSGQSVVHADGDLIVLGSVASGAEVCAGGSIHVYGALKGRAVAGMAGRSDARIFARLMQPELLAIDGYYAIADEIDADVTGVPAQAQLIDSRITLKGMS